MVTGGKLIFNFWNAVNGRTKPHTSDQSTPSTKERSPSKAQENLPPYKQPKSEYRIRMLLKKLQRPSNEIRQNQTFATNETIHNSFAIPRALGCPSSQRNDILVSIPVGSIDETEDKTPREHMASNAAANNVVPLSEEPQAESDVDRMYARAADNHPSLYTTNGTDRMSVDSRRRVSSDAHSTIRSSSEISFQDELLSAAISTAPSEYSSRCSSASSIVIGHGPIGYSDNVGTIPAVAPQAKAELVKISSADPAIPPRADSRKFKPISERELMNILDSYLANKSETQQQKSHPSNSEIESTNQHTHHHDEREPLPILPPPPASSAPPSAQQQEDLESWGDNLISEFDRKLNIYRTTDSIRKKYSEFGPAKTPPFPSDA